MIRPGGCCRPALVGRTAGVRSWESGCSEAAPGLREELCQKHVTRIDFQPLVSKGTAGGSCAIHLPVRGGVAAITYPNPARSVAL